MSLRQAESAAGRGRGLLSQVENGRAHPPRDLVEWYGDAFGDDGLLSAIYAEARGARGANSRRRADTASPSSDDLSWVRSPLISLGQLVDPGAQVTAGWTLHNRTGISWIRHSLRRVGPHRATRLISSPPAVAVPSCAPGESVQVQIPVVVPTVLSTMAAYWELVDAEGRTASASPTPFAVLITTY